ncbi:hypothetical protein mRhiFer1_009658 [Rhinolophus ferrumequinum]|uniref:Uncharacterized protein n=1 Tax=Rhinolophus ferrumequinum TaxID=59479 RepID=A0A7J7R6C2_RHIFE|nr:hypothetical protein mRhiFer1_009658 [Rhinolophus ferrumequinum]
MGGGTRRQWAGEDPGTERPGHQRRHGNRPARGCQTFLARGARGRCRGTVKRNLPIMNSVSGNPHPHPTTTTNNCTFPCRLGLSPQTTQGDSTRSELQPQCSTPNGCSPPPTKGGPQPPISSTNGVTGQPSSKLSPHPTLLILQPPTTDSGIARQDSPA